MRKPIMTLITIISSILLLLAVYIIYSIFFYHNHLIKNTEKKYNQLIIDSFNESIESFNVLKDIFIDNDGIYIQPSRWRDPSLKGFDIAGRSQIPTKYEEHELYNEINTNAINNIMSDELYVSYDIIKKIKCNFICPRTTDDQNKYVQFNLNLDNVILMYSDTGEIWEVDYPYYAKKEVWINENWYIQYVIQRRG